MKAYCTNCKEIKPASFRKFIYTTHPAEYEDLCCDECHMILATVEEREASLNERRLAAITRWLEAEQPDVFRRGIWEAINAA